MSNGCFVYLMEMGVPVANGQHMVKVGISANPKGRLAQLRTGSPFRIDILDMWRLPTREDAAWIERRFHSEFAKERQTGEWFVVHNCGAADYLLMLLGQCWTQKRRGPDSWLDNWLSNAGITEADTRSYIIGEVAA